MMNTLMATTDKAIAERVREAREDAGLSQEYVGQKLGLTDAGYGHYERGRQSFTLAMIFKLADILGQSVEYFLGLTTDLTKNEAQLLALYRVIGNEAGKRVVLSTVRSAASEWRVD